MQKDTQQELERLERELLEADGAPLELEDLDFSDLDLPESVAADDEFDQEFLAEIRSILNNDGPVEPAFDDPQTIHEPEEPLVYCNYSNDYGRDLQAFADDPETEAPKTDRFTVGLMITACVLTLGIIGVLLYWLVAFL